MAVGRLINSLFTCALTGSITLGSGLFDFGNAGLQLGKSLLRKLWLGAAISQDLVIKEDMDVKPDIIIWLSGFTSHISLFH